MRRATDAAIALAAVILPAAGAACAGPTPIEPVAPSFLPAPATAPVIEPAPTLGRPARLELSVEAATMLALRNNRDLRVQSYGPVIAGTFERIERGVFGPELFAAGQAFQENATQTARATGEQFDVEGRNTDLRAGVRQRLPTGTEIEAAVGHRYDESDRTPEQQEARIGLTVTQALLQGLGPAVNLVAVRRAELEAEASRYELRAFIQSLLAQTEIAYWTYVLAKEEIAIFERSLEVGRRELADVEVRVEIGQLPPLDAAPARVEVARREQALIDAESRLEEARLRLNRLVSPDPTGRLDVPIVATSDPRLEPRPIDDAAQRVELAVRYRPELKEAELRRRQNRLETIVTRNGVLPRLDVFVALGKTGFDDSFSASFGALGEPTYDVRAGFDFSQLVAHRPDRALDVRARASARQSAEAVENLRQLVQLEVRLAVNEVERARAQIAASATTRALQAQTVRAEKERFDVGASTTLLVAQAQRDLLASQIAEVRAVVDYRSALVRLYLAEGTLLARRGVSLRDDG